MRPLTRIEHSRPDALAPADPGTTRHRGLRRTLTLWSVPVQMVLGNAACDPAPAVDPSESETPHRASSAEPALRSEAPAPRVDVGQADAIDPQPVVEDETKPDAAPDPRTLDGSFTASIGSPVEGHLQGSVALPLRGDGFVFDPRKDTARRYGTWEMVRALLDAAATVHDALPGNPLVVGDLSLESGGDLSGHASHRSGRDVDVMFYLQREDGTPFDGKAIPIEPDGTGTDYRDLTTPDDDVIVRIDVPRTWAFVAALVSDERNHLGRIFVVEHVRTMLLEEAKRVGTPQNVVERAGHLMCQPKFPHDDHMHIRFFCSPDDIEQGCLDTAPIFPWQRRFLRSAKVTAKLAGPRTKPRPVLTSTEDAAKKTRASVGTFDPAVDAFLERRKAWAKKPRTGRTYCR